MRTLVPLAVAALLLLAGCGGGAAPSTATPAPTAETPSAPGPADVAGVNDTAVDASALVEGHRAALTNRSLTLDVVAVDNDTRTTLTERVESGGRPLLVRSASGNRSRTTYVANGTTYERLTRGNESSYRSANRTGASAYPASYTGSRIVWQYMSTATYRPNGTTVENGTGLLALSATAADLNESALAAANVTVDTFRSTAYVDDAGVVRKFTYRVEGTRDGVPFSQTLRVRVTDVGSTDVPRPDWLDRA
ncbi:MAG: hypothetical protein ABEJ78_06475 [Haloferacaceae archaeon]